MTAIKPPHLLTSVREQQHRRLSASRTLGLYHGLDVREKLLGADEHRQRVIVHDVAENTPAAKIGDPTGIPASKLTDKQRETLMKLMGAYTNRMPSSVGEAEMKAVKEAGMEKVYFGYSGSPEPGKGYTYQIQGPTFVAQFLNMQADGSGNPANHIHSVWRKLPADFGLKGR